MASFLNAFGAPEYDRLDRQDINSFGGGGLQSGFAGGGAGPPPPEYDRLDRPSGMGGVGQSFINPQLPPWITRGSSGFAGGQTPQARLPGPAVQQLLTNRLGARPGGFAPRQLIAPRQNTLGSQSSAMGMNPFGNPFGQQWGLNGLSKMLSGAWGGRGMWGDQ
jgi:hypothetical protein